MSSNIGFYYPQNVFPDDWIKLAVLYWDKIARIKWKRGPLGDSDTVRQLADEMDFVINLTPSSKELSFVADNFIETISKHKDVLQRHYSRVSREGWRQAISIDSDLISSDFMTTELFDIIIKSGLGWWFFGGAGFRHPKGLPFTIDEEGNIDPPEIDFDELEGGGDFGCQLWPEMYLLYMRSLAEKMATDNQMHLVTDRVFDHVASCGYTTERLLQAVLPSDDSLPHLIDPRPTVDELVFQMATIAFRSVIPRNISEVPAKQIIKLRNHYSSEMIAFQENIRGFAADLEKLQNIPDAKALKAHLEVEYEKRLKPQMGDLQKCLKSIGIDTVMGALNVRLAIPPILAGTGTLLHIDPLSPLIICAGAIAFSIFPVIQKQQQETRKIVRSSPAAYLLHIRETLEPAKAATQVIRRARQIFYRQ